MALCVGGVNADRENQLQAPLLSTQIIAHVVWIYARFNLSLREVEELMLERGVDVPYEAMRRWTVKFGPLIAHILRRRQPRPDDVWHLDESELCRAFGRRVDCSV